MKDTISVVGGRAVGIGKLKVFATDSFKHEIPMLSFIVAKTETGDFIATCIQLCVDGDGATPKAATENMRTHCIDFLHSLFGNEKTRGYEWDNLHELFTEENTELEKMITDLRAMIDTKNPDLTARVIEYDEVA